MTSNDRDCKGKSPQYGGIYLLADDNEVMQRIANHSCYAQLVAEKLLRSTSRTGVPGLTENGREALRASVPKMSERSFNAALAYLIEIGFVEHDPTCAIFFVPLALTALGPVATRGGQAKYLHGEAQRVLKRSPLLHRVMALLPPLKLGTGKAVSTGANTGRNSQTPCVNLQNGRESHNSQESQNHWSDIELVEVKEVREEIRAAACGAPFELKENLNVSLNATSTTTTSSPPAAEDRTGLARRGTEPVVVVENDLLRKWMAELTAKRTGDFTSCSQAGAAKLPQLREELAHPALQREIAAGHLNLSQVAAKAADITLEAAARKKVGDSDAYYLGVALCLLTQHREACEKAARIPATPFSGTGGGHGTYPPLRVVSGGSQRVGFRHKKDVALDLARDRLEREVMGEVRHAQ